MSRVFIIAEAGSNMFAGPRDDVADFARALALIDIAADAGADAFKVQFWSDASRVYAPNAGTPAYLAAKGETRDIGTIFDDLRLPREWLPKLAAHCDARSVEFMASVFHPDDVPAVDPFVRRHKIASYEMGYEALVRACVATGKPLIVSTGAHTLAEISQAGRWAIDAGCTDLTLMHCAACYPAPPEALNLCAIPIVSNPVLHSGYSDHSPQWWTPIAAVMLSADVIEKHITTSRELLGPDHAFALEPPELREMVHAIRTVEMMSGNGTKRVEPAEEALRRFAVRHVQAIVDLKPGDPIIEGETVACLRPGNRPAGVWAGNLGKMRGKRVRRAITAGDGVGSGDVE